MLIWNWICYWLRCGPLRWCDRDSKGADHLLSLLHVCRSFFRSFLTRTLSIPLWFMPGFDGIIQKVYLATKFASSSCARPLRMSFFFFVRVYYFTLNIWLNKRTICAECTYEQKQEEINMIVTDNFIGRANAGRHATGASWAVHSSSNDKCLGFDHVSATRIQWLEEIIARWNNNINEVTLHKIVFVFIFDAIICPCSTCQLFFKRLSLRTSPLSSSSSLLASIDDFLYSDAIS